MRFTQPFREKLALQSRYECQNLLHKWKTDYRVRGRDLLNGGQLRVLGDDNEDVMNEEEGIHFGFSLT